MKLSVLELTQLILSAMDSDEVDSIGDTAEARQVAQVIRTAYFNILSRANLPEHKKLFSLVSTDSSTPVLMTKPENVIRMEWIKYNKFDEDDDNEDSFQYVIILPIQQFLDFTHQFNEDESDVDIMTLNNQTFYFKNDVAPSYCTVLDDYYVVFDSFNSAVDSHLQTSKTQCYGDTAPTFLLEDSYIPEIDEQQFPLLLNEAKSLAFLELKQMNHDLAMLESRRQWRTLQRTKTFEKPNTFDQLPNFGRRC